MGASARRDRTVTIGTLAARRVVSLAACCRTRTSGDMPLRRSGSGHGPEHSVPAWTCSARATRRTLQPRAAPAPLDGPMIVVRHIVVRERLAEWRYPHRLQTETVRPGPPRTPSGSARHRQRRWYKTRRWGACPARSLSNSAPVALPMSFSSDVILSPTPRSLSRTPCSSGHTQVMFKARVYSCSNCNALGINSTIYNERKPLRFGLGENRKKKGGEVNAMLKGSKK